MTSGFNTRPREHELCSPVFKGCVVLRVRICVVGSMYTYGIHAAHLGIGRSVHFVPSRRVCAPAARCKSAPGRRIQVRKVRELNACIASLEAVQARNDVEPEQKECIKLAINELRKLRRNPHARMDKVLASVRTIAEALVKASLAVR